MRKELVLILTVLLVLGIFSPGYAAAGDAAAENELTLEKAKALVHENSRNLKKYEIKADKAKYQLYQAEEQRNDLFYTYNSLSARYDNLAREYSSLQEQLNQGDTSVVARMDEIEAQMREIEGELESQYDKVESSSDSIGDAEDNYDDSVKEKENYRKQLDFIVDEICTTILNQEDTLLTLKKEYELKQYLLDVEKRKLQRGKSSQLKVSQLNADVVSLNEPIAKC